MSTKIIEKKIWLTIFCGVALGFFLFACSKDIHAWIEPSTLPPATDLTAPINSSAIGQSKIGGLILNLGGATHGLIVKYGLVGIGTNNPQSALDVVGTIIGTGLEINSETEGALISRMTTDQRNAISGAEEGMLVYNTTERRFNYHTAGSWKVLGDSGSSSIFRITTEYAVGDGRTGDYYCKKKNITDGNQQEDWININDGKICGAGEKICGAGECKDLSCGIDLYKIALTCSAVGTGYYSPAADNNRYACTNKSTNSSYTGSGGGTNNCPWSCDGGYVKSGESCIPSFTCGTSQVTDSGGNVYDTVQIGSQCWMKQNMRVGNKLASGATMPTNNGVVEKWCYANNDVNCTTYGGLYQWDEAMQYSTIAGAQGICPTGWHIPTDGEQFTLENYLKDAGQTCVVTSTLWQCSPAGTKLQIGGSSGFNAPIGGFRDLTTGSFYLLGAITEIWSSTQDGTGAWSRMMNSGYALINRGITQKNYGYSVRCLKN